MWKASTNSGFSLIEVLVALVIFTVASIIAVGITTGSVRAVRDSRERSIATWLVQSSMVELETRLESEGIEKGCEKKKEGKFPAPYENFSWVSSCYEVDFHLSEAAAKLQEMENAGKEPDQTSQENVIRKMILDTTSDYITKAMRELHTEVSWLSGKDKQTVTLTTHFVRYDQQLNLPIGAAGTPAASTPGG